MTQELADLVIACQQSNKAAIEKLYKQKKPLVTYILFKAGVLEANIPDLAQDVFLKVFRSLDRLKEPHAFNKWFRLVARSVLNDHLRDSKRRSQCVSLTTEDGEDLELADETSRPEDAVEKQDEHMQFIVALKALPLHAQALVNLRVIHELDYQEIADRLNCPIGTVKSGIYRAKKRLKELCVG